MSQTSANPLLNELSISISDLSPQNGPQIGLVPELVAAQATIRPDAIAAVHGKALLTYKELNQRADLLARFLQSVGVGPDVVVGVHMNRSLAMVVAALGIIKAGGAHRPLDTHHHTVRLASMLNDART